MENRQTKLDETVRGIKALWARELSPGVANAFEAVQGEIEKRETLEPVVSSKEPVVPSTSPKLKVL